MQIPSQVTAGALSTLVILGVAMLNSLGIWTLTDDQLLAVGAFVTAASNLGFGVLLWAINRDNPNPTAP
jgi:hypothetical protein